MEGSCVVRKCMMSQLVAVALCGIGLAAGVGNGHKTGAVQTGTASWSTGEMKALGGESKVWIKLRRDGVVPQDEVKVLKNGKTLPRGSFIVVHYPAQDEVIVTLIGSLTAGDSIQVFGTSTNDSVKVASSGLE